MQQVIATVLAAEEEARNIVERARREAEGILQNARLEAEEIAQRGRQETRLETEQIRESSAREAGREEAAQLERAEAELNAHLKLDPETRQRAIRAVIRCVCGQAEPGRETHAASGSQ